MKAVVFAYHDVGVRCLKTLLARGVDVPLVVTHADSPAENIWFHSVAGVCREYGIPCLMSEDPESPQLQEQVQTARPDFIFSFYYRRMLPPSLLAMAEHGAYNMHGSLLPKYRGRAPVNWAILHGETETGATLHAMTARPDAGAIVAQTTVPILPDDTAFEVFGKVVLAAEQTLWRVLPSMLAGCAPTLPNDLSKGSYFSGREPEDGRIDWGKTAQHIHNLVRAVAPPYPGAFEEISGDKITLARTRMVPTDVRLTLERSHRAQDRFFEDGCLYARCGDGNYLQILSIRINDQDVSLNNYLEYMAA
ncbi:MAG: formyltransferase [Herbaspirillum sp.]